MALPVSHNPQIQPASNVTSMGDRKIKILVADEHPIVREGMSALLARQPDMEVVGYAPNGQPDLAGDGEVSPDVVLFDFSASVSVFGIAKKYSSAKIIVFTARESEEHIYQAVQSGARGYLLKSALLEEILECIRTVVRGQSWIPRQMGELLAKRMAAPELTKRERDVLAAMAQGKSNREIGNMLQLSEGTVKVHVTHILEKLKVNGRTEALAAATARGLVSLMGRSDYKAQSA